MITAEATMMKGKALFQTKDRHLIVYRKGTIVIYKDELPATVISLPVQPWIRLLYKVRIIERALHADIRWMIDISETEFLFLYSDSIYRLDLKTQSVDKDFSGFRGRPFSVIRIGECIVFGDYGGNEKREPVNIYIRENGKWRVAYSFPKGTIRHIHNIIRKENTLFILTGDEDSESGIWTSDLDFKSVKRVYTGSQQYRCCQLIADSTKSGWYATDAPSEQNWIYHFNEHMINRVYALPGTVIYGTRFNNMLIFSTTVEPDAHAKNKMEYWLTNKPGKGITANETKVYLLKDGHLTEVASYYHDKKPLRLFQYATVYFSNVIEGVAFFTPTSVKHYDNHIMKYRLQ